MTNLKVVVVDDEQLARSRMSRLLGAMDDIEVVEVLADGDALLALLDARDDIDVLLLDIQMPGLTGLDLSGLLPEGGPVVIFVTAHQEHAVKAFALGVVDYVVKPVAPERLRLALTRAAEQRKRHQQPVPHKIPIHTHKGILLLDITAISHASYDGALVNIHLQNDGKSVTTESSLTELEERLQGQGFFRVHRRHLVKVDGIERLEPIESGRYLAHMHQGDAVPVSRQAAKGLRQLLGLM